MSEAAQSPLMEPVRILSDLHLAHPASLVDRVASLRPLLEGAATVIFNGDTCEQCCRAWRDEGRARLEELTELCAEAGARPVFLAGNHDPAISGEGWIELAEGAVFVTHGHAIVPSVAPWSPEYLRRKRRIREILREQAPRGADLAERWETTRVVTDLLKPERPRKLGDQGRKYVLSALWPPERCFHILRVWLTMIGAASRFMDRFRPEAAVLLFGHFHRSGVWERKGRIICNTGAFMRGSRPLMAEFRKGSLSIFDLIRNDGAFRAGPARRTVRIRHDGRS